MTTARCPKCGGEVPPDAPGGLCPRCLLEVGAAPTGPTPDQADAAMSVEAVQADFPQFEVLECIGRGGMGVVYLARQPALDRLVALKILAPRVKDDPAFAERFHREARALARLSHPNIVGLHDFGEANGRCYLIMEYVDGISLRDALDGARLSPEEALSIVPVVCGALQFAHDRGIVHRDIKPENILLDRDGRIKIVDFGLAKIVSPERKDFTLTGARDVMGTPHYMAPEQIDRPSRVDHRADIYALGVVFYEMLTGELPLGRFAPPSSKVHVDVRLDEVVLRTLEREPERRYQQANALKTDVENIAAHPAPAVEAISEPSAMLPGLAASREEWTAVLCGLNTGLCLSGAAHQLDRGNDMFALVSAIAGVLSGVVAVRNAHHVRVRTAPDFRRVLWYAFVLSAVGLVFGLQGGHNLVWGLGLSGVLVAGMKLGLIPTKPPPPGPAACGKHKDTSTVRSWTVAAAVAVVLFFIGQALAVIPGSVVSPRQVPMVFAVSVLVFPLVVVLCESAVRGWLVASPGATAPRGRPWLMAWGWTAVLLAVPVIALGGFFLWSMYAEAGFSQWNPGSTAEAIVVPLTWAGSVLLPLAAAVLFGAARHQSVEH